MKQPEDMRLTTMDNPYNPHDQYELWRRWDIENGYNTESFIARMADIPLSVDVDDDSIMTLLAHQATLEILENDVEGIYVLV